MNNNSVFAVQIRMNVSHCLISRVDNKFKSKDWRSQEYVCRFSYLYCELASLLCSPVRGLDPQATPMAQHFLCYMCDEACY